MSPITEPWQKFVKDFINGSACTFHYLHLSSASLNTFSDHEVMTHWNLTSYSDLLQIPMFQIRLLLKHTMMGVFTFQIEPRRNETLFRQFLTNGRVMKK